MGRFTPVYDPEKTRNEQDENELRKHRQFDTPFAQLKKDLNDKERKPKGDMEPLGRQTGELAQDENKLWRKKAEIFDKEKTWGRETSEYQNPEEARIDGKSKRKKDIGTHGWGTSGVFGGRGSDMGDQVLQRNEVEQTLEKNEKGLWVRRKVDREKACDEPVQGDNWRCPKCKEENIRKRHLCKECGFDRTKLAEESNLMRAPAKGEDPRLEAAKAKGRGTADAAKLALKALEERRKGQKVVMDQMGLTSAPRGSSSRSSANLSMTLNSSASQVRPQRRNKKHRDWQGVQRSDEEARKVIAKALGDSAVGGASSSAAKAEAAPSGDRAKRSRSPRRRSRSCSWSLSPSRSQSCSPPREGAEGTGEDVVVDFF